MSPPCIVGFCTNRGTHVFPRDETRRGNWIQAVKYIKPGLTVRKHSRICSAHFKQTDFSRTALSMLKSDAVQKTLKKTAVPSIFPWKPVPKESPLTTTEDGSLTFNYAESTKTYTRTALPLTFVEEQSYLETVENCLNEDPLQIKNEEINFNNDESILEYDIKGNIAIKQEEPNEEMSFQVCEFDNIEKQEKSVQTQDYSVCCCGAHHCKNFNSANPFYTNLENLFKLLILFYTLGKCAH